MIRLFVVAFIIVSSIVLSSAQFPSVFVTQPAVPPTSGGPGITIKQWNATGSNNQTTQFTLAVITNPVPHFHVYSALDSSLSCGVGMMNTSALGAQFGCLFATNGSPRNWVVPYCAGVVVSDGQFQQTDWNSTDGGFGLLPNNTWGMGYFNKTDFKRLNFSQYLYGFDWMVVGGVSQLDTDGGEVAPRTSIGTDKNGNLMIMVVDGIEKATPPVGLTVYAQAQVWLQVGGYNVMNLDGGGSSTAYYNGNVINYPHCEDVPNVWCEREISDITCIK